MKSKLIIYCYEALGLGIFMISAGYFTMMIENPNLNIRQHISSTLLRRFLIGIAMGTTALYIFTSPFGKKSGSHINPAVTLVQYRLKNINATDSFFYMLFQFLGGSIGMYLIYFLFSKNISHPSVNFIVTQPAEGKVYLAFILEFLISLLTILVVLITGKDTHFKGSTNYFVAALIVLYVTFESPFSGFSMNPARTFASAIVANQWKSFWLYCTAPILGMLSGQLIFSNILKISFKKMV